MALYFDGTDGNGNCTLAGHWNASDAGGYTPSFAGATALSIVFTVKPDSLAGGLWPLVHCGATGGYSQVFFVYHVGNGALLFRLVDNNGSDIISRTGTTAQRALVAGQTCRVVLRWAGATDTMTCTVNGVNFPFTYTAAPAFGSTAITRLNPLAIANSGGLELGGQSGDDSPPVPGVYQEWAIWSAYLSDRDVELYGLTGRAALLTQATGRCHYVSLTKLASVATTTPLGNGGAGYIARLTDEWSGAVYGQATTTYDYGGGTFLQPYTGVFSGSNPFVADLAYGELIQDRDSLPVEYFDLEELNGQCGQRSGVQIHIPGDYADLPNAMWPAQYGDDIVIDHTYALPTIDSRYLPEKTFNATTPRMPPHQKRPLTMGRPLTSAR